MRILKYLYESILIWVLLIFLGVGIDLVYTVMSILEESKSDPSAGAILGFLPYLFPIFFIKPIIILVPVCIIYKLIYWYKNERN